MDRPAEQRIVVLHPRRWRPRRRQQEQVRIDLAHLAQRRQDPLFVMVDGELRELRIGCGAVVVAVSDGRVIARSDAVYQLGHATRICEGLKNLHCSPTGESYPWSLHVFPPCRCVLNYRNHSEPALVGACQAETLLTVHYYL